MHGQAAQPFAQSAGPFGSQHELGHIVGAVIQGTLPVILGSLRGQQPQAMGGFGIPAMLPQQSYGAQPDVSHLLGPVLQATLPVILQSLRGGQQVWQGGQGFGGGQFGFGAGGFPALQGQYGFGGGQADLGHVLGPVLQATLPVILQSLRGQQPWQGGQMYGQMGGIPAFQGLGQFGQQGYGPFGGQGEFGAILGPVLQAALPAILGSMHTQSGQAGMWRN